MAGFGSSFDSSNATHLAMGGLALGGIAGLGAIAISPWLRARAGLKCTLVKTFLRDGIIKDDQSSSFGEWWSRMKTMYFICWLEENHQLNILEAGGEEAVEKDPTLLFRSALPHLRHVKKMREMRYKSLSPVGISNRVSRSWLPVRPAVFF